ncbi:MAG: hypothetical protein ACPGUV_11165, partial [Polyangiales bacterium]
MDAEQSRASAALARLQRADDPARRQLTDMLVDTVWHMPLTRTLSSASMQALVHAWQQPAVQAHWHTQLIAPLLDAVRTLLCQQERSCSELLGPEGTEA